MIVEQRAYIEALKRADSIRNRYGNRRAMRAAARKHIEATLAAIGYAPVAIEVIRKDAYDMYVLERECDATH
jgi:hypothetical protein